MCQVLFYVHEIFREQEMHEAYNLVDKSGLHKKTKRGRKCMVLSAKKKNYCKVILCFGWVVRETFPRCDI